MLNSYIKRMISEAVEKAVREAVEKEPVRLTSEALREDLDLMILHGAEVAKKTQELHSYAHDQIHTLRNILTKITLTISEVGDALDEQEKLSERVRKLADDLQASKFAPPGAATGQ